MKLVSTLALGNRLHRERREALTAKRKAALTSSAQRMADLIGPEGLADHGAFLYEKQGAPKAEIAAADEKDVHE